MGPHKGRKRIVIGSVFGAVGLLAILSFTGPTTDQDVSGAVQRKGGPCLTLERWGLFGWASVGQTGNLIQATRGEWEEFKKETGCEDIPDSIILLRMPSGTKSGVYRICGTADDLPCTTVRVVPFESDGPGP